MSGSRTKGVGPRVVLRFTDDARVIWRIGAARVAMNSSHHVREPDKRGRTPPRFVGPLAKHVREPDKRGRTPPRLVGPLAKAHSFTDDAPFTWRIGATHVAMN